MQDICILCGKEVQRGGFSARVEGVILRPLCPTCDAMCSKEPKRVFDEHRDLFERIGRREPSRIAPNNPHTSLGDAQIRRVGNAAQERSQRDHSLSNRYFDAYRVANFTVAFGNIVKTVGEVLAVLIFVLALILAAAFASSMRGQAVYLALGWLLCGAVLGGGVGFFFFILGTLVGANGQQLRADLDSAVNTSPFLGDDSKAEIMSL